MNENKYLKYQPVNINNLDSETLRSALNVCPFSNSSHNEDEIAEKVFSQENTVTGDVIGHYKSLYAGHVTDDSLRLKTTSGGIITWTLLQLFNKKLIDGVIHVKTKKTVGKIFEYGISTTPEEIVNGAKSRYYPIEISEVIDIIRNSDKKFAFVGLPCFTKAVRKIALNDQTISDKIPYFIGLVCGHLKSKAFSEYVGWQAGVHPTNLKYIDFRHKIADRPANNYGIEIENDKEEKKVLVARDTLGTNWGLGYFKYEACDFCDDIFSETADLAVGDAWLKNYTVDSKGNSVVITRNAVIDNIIKEGIDLNAIKLDSLTDEEMRKAQGGGFRHRRVALGYRLYLKQKKNLWFPVKRVPINKNALSKGRKLIFKLRVYLRDKSTEYWYKAKEKNNLNSFQRKMKLPGMIYQLMLNAVSLMQRLK
jgi:coenzyme F420-reducing hydrogenase beta subunit